MENSTAVVLGKIGFYLALVAFVVIIIIKKRKQVKGTHKNMHNDNHK